MEVPVGTVFHSTMLLWNAPWLQIFFRNLCHGPNEEKLFLTKTLLLGINYEIELILSLLFKVFDPGSDNFQDSTNYWAKANSKSALLPFV